TDRVEAFGRQGISATTAVPAGRTSRQSSAGEQAPSAAANSAMTTAPRRRRTRSAESTRCFDKVGKVRKVEKAANIAGNYPGAARAAPTMPR
ncbi:MAG: hypothetical protein U1F25_19535, partial [Rubrivivax sp.]